MKGKIFFVLLLCTGLISVILLMDWSFLPYNLRKWIPKLPHWEWKWPGGGDKDPSISDIEDANQRTVDSLKTIITGYETRQVELDARIEAYNDSIAELSLQIQQDRKDIQNLRNKANAQVTLASKYSTRDIYEFLADRYGETLSK